MALADLWGRLALIGGKTPHNRLSRLCYCKKDSRVGLKEVEAGGNGVQNPSSRVESLISVVQTPVEVTESSLSMSPCIWICDNTHKL